MFLLGIVVMYILLNKYCYVMLQIIWYVWCNKCHVGWNFMGIMKCFNYLQC